MTRQFLIRTTSLVLPFPKLQPPDGGEHDHLVLITNKGVAIPHFEDLIYTFLTIKYLFKIFFDNGLTPKIIEEECVSYLMDIFF